MESSEQKRLAEAAGEAAVAFHHEGYHCAESVLRAVASVLNVQVDSSLLRATTGFRGGGGGFGDRCGALNAGVMAFGLIYGRTDSERDHTCVSALTKKLHERFMKEMGTTMCGVLRPIAHEQWSKDYSCTAVYRKAAEYAVDLILQADEHCFTCGRFDVDKGQVING